MKYKKLAAIFAGLAVATTTQAAIFYDAIEIPSWAESAIESVEDAGIMTGYADRTFRPNTTINRAEALVILFRTQDIDYDSVTYARNFTDVPRDAWFAAAVNKAVEEGWIEGFDDGTFRPGNTINNAEWATLLLRAFDLPADIDDAPALNDVPSHAWFAEAVFSQYTNGLVRNPRSLNFRPGEEVSRAEAAWTISTILRMPRLMGTSQSNDFSEQEGARYVDSRRVAYPRGSDFNPNLQGYESTRQELVLVGDGGDDPVGIRPSTDWTTVGVVRMKNNMTDPVSLNSIEFKTRFESSGVGPADYFEARILGPGIDRIVPGSRTGTYFFSGVSLYLEPEEEAVVRLKIKAMEGKSFYTKSGEGLVSIESADGLMYGTFSEGSEHSGSTSVRSLPIKFEERRVGTILFEP